MRNLSAVILLVFLFSHLLSLAQENITLTFTAINNTSYTQLDSIRISNKTKSCDTLLLWNDTVLSLNIPVKIPNNIINNESLDLRCFPNPVTNHATIEVNLPASGNISLMVFDVLGRKVFAMDRFLRLGKHYFDFIPGNAFIYFITINWNNFSKAYKVINYSKNKNKSCLVSYIGSNEQTQTLKNFNFIQDFEFELGDELLYIGYRDALESGITDAPISSQYYTFQFASNIPCPGVPTVEYEGQIYNTIQIFSQCWMKENLNVGLLISGSQEMEDNGIIEKYCYDDEPDNCIVYGGLYQWNEAMQYLIKNSQGICPEGWHIASDEEWKILEGSVDSQFGVGNLVWNEQGIRGFDAGHILKSTHGWYDNGCGLDAFGFTVLPGGYRDTDGNFLKLLENAYFFSSTEVISNFAAYNRGFAYPQNDVLRAGGVNMFGLSIRCIKDF